MSLWMVLVSVFQILFFAASKVEKDMSQGFCNSRNTTNDLPYLDSGI